MGDEGKSRVSDTEPVGGGAQKERSFEIGKDEAWYANVKRMYDEYQHRSLVSIDQNRVHFDKLISDAQQYDNQRQQLANQALSNAVDTANLVNKQAAAHRDLSIDAQLNPVQQGAADALTIRAVSIDDASLKAIGAVVAAALAEALSKKSA